MRLLTTCLLISTFSLLGFKTDSIIGYEVGDKAINFDLVNASKTVNGIDQTVSLDDYKNAKGFIVIFTCNHCPFSKAYEDRIISLQTKYEKKGIHVVAINPNDKERQPADSYEKMKTRAKEKGFNFAYLYDETQDIAKAYGARKTPHVYLLDSEREVKYIGAIDDNTEGDMVKKKYVENAIAEMLNGKPITKSTSKAIGCTIKWKQ